MVATLFAKILWHTDFTLLDGGYQQRIVDNIDKSSKIKVIFDVYLSTTVDKYR